MAINLSLHAAVKKDANAQKASSVPDKSPHAQASSKTQQTRDPHETRKPFAQILHDQARPSTDVERAKTSAKSDPTLKAKSNVEETIAGGKKVPAKKEREDSNPLDALVQTIQALMLPAKIEPVAVKSAEGEKKSETPIEKLKVVSKEREREAKPADRVDVLALLAATADTKLEGGKESGGKKNATKSDERKISVLDLRTQAKEKSAGEDAAVKNAVTSSVEVVQTNKAKEYKPSEEFRVAFEAVQGKSKDPVSTQASNAPIPQRDAAALAQYLQDRGYIQLVDQARIVLRNNNQGEIRMTLYPESLGKVKVALNLENSHLAGKIFVENQSVKDVFQQSLDQLTQAFRDGGFQNVNIQVSVGGENRSRDERENVQVAQIAGQYGKNVAQVAGPTVLVAKIHETSDKLVNLTV